MNHLEHYPKVLHLEELRYFDLKPETEYIIEEKVDGSQFRFGLKDGKRFYGSHNIDYDAERQPDALFAEAVAGANEILDSFDELIVPHNYDITFFAEFLKAPRHNTLTYARVPTHHLVVFDILFNNEYQSRSDKEKICELLGCEVVPLLMKTTTFPDISVMDELIKTTSFLGNTQIEGVVIKNYAIVAERFNLIRPLILKYVRDDFKELNNKNWNEANPRTIEKVWDKVINCQQVYQKALQHIKESGKYTGELCDIAPMIEEVRKDVETEYKTLLIEAMWEFHKKELVRWITRGLPNFYKDYIYREAQSILMDKSGSEKDVQQV